MGICCGNIQPRHHIKSVGIIPVPKWEEENCRLQVAVRLNNEAGDTFGINYSRYHPKKVLGKFEVNLKDKTLSFSSEKLKCKDSSGFLSGP